MGDLTINRKKMKMTAVWLHPVYHKLIKKCAAELKSSNKNVVEQAIEDWVSRHPSLYHLFEEFILEKKEILDDDSSDS